MGKMTKNSRNIIGGNMKTDVWQEAKRIQRGIEYRKDKVKFSFVAVKGKTVLFYVISSKWKIGHDVNGRY